MSHASDEAFDNYGEVVVSVYTCDLGFHSFTESPCCDVVFACSLNKEASIPHFVLRHFRKHFFGASACAACQRPMVKASTCPISFAQLTESTSKSFIVCDCDHPVWRTTKDLYGRALDEMLRGEHIWRRAQRLRDAAGRHTEEEFRAIVELQRGKCLYCNVVFSKGMRPSRDHVVPLSNDGTNSADNIVAACRSCNSRRGDIPFGTYCRLLSLSQYGKTFRHLQRRIVADSRNRNLEQVQSFCTGITLDEPNHPRYLDILRTQKRRRPVALLLSSPDKIVQRRARRLLLGNNSLIEGLVQAVTKQMQN